jgi:exonuclease III
MPKRALPPPPCAAEEATEELLLQLTQVDDEDVARAALATLPAPPLPPAPQRDASAFRGAVRRPNTARACSGALRYADTALCPKAEGWGALLVPQREPAVRGSSGLRLYTHNVCGIRKRTEGDGGQELGRLLRKFDIVALQELKADEAASLGALQAATQSSSGGPRFETYIHAGAGGACGVAILLRASIAVGAEVTHRDFLPVSAAAGAAGAAARQYRALTVAVPQCNLALVCVHRVLYESEGGPAWNAAFLAHVRALCEGGRHVVVLGDLNCWPGEVYGEAREGSVVAALQQHEQVFLDCTHGTSEERQPTHFPARGPEGQFGFQRIDYILLPRALRQQCLVAGSGRVLSVRAPWGDHVPVECHLMRGRVLRAAL